MRNVSTCKMGYGVDKDHEGRSHSTKNNGIWGCQESLEELDPCLIYCYVIMLRVGSRGIPCCGRTHVGPRFFVLSTGLQHPFSFQSGPIGSHQEPYPISIQPLNTIQNPKYLKPIKTS